MRVMKRVIALAAVFVLVVGSLAVYAWQQRKVAQDSADEANRLVHAYSIRLRSDTGTMGW